MTKPIAISCGLLLLLFGLAFAKTSHHQDSAARASVDMSSLNR